MLTLCPSVIDRDVPTLYITALFQALAEFIKVALKRSGRTAAQKPDHRHRRLLRSRRQWPRCCRAAENGNKLAASHLVLLPQNRLRGAIFSVLFICHAAAPNKLTSRAEVFFFSGSISVGGWRTFPV
jgi:hypothetical protein